MTRLHSVFLTNSEVEDFQTDTQTSFAIQRGCRGYISYIITELAGVWHLSVHINLLCVAQIHGKKPQSTKEQQ